MHETLSTMMAGRVILLTVISTSMIWCFILPYNTIFSYDNAVYALKHRFHMVKTYLFFLLYPLLFLQCLYLLRLNQLVVSCYEHY